MNRSRRKFLWLAAALAAGQTLLAPLRAQIATNAPPLPPPVKSPVEAFRELLALTPAERKKILAGRSPETQQRLLAKLREYQSLKPDQRELRLRATELRWYLLPLMRSPATDRAAQLGLIPPDLRPLVDDRLAPWDKLAPAAQKELLENEQTGRYFTQLADSPAEQREKILAALSPERRAQLEAGLDRWRAMTEDQRRKTCERFDQFFELTPAEKEKALRTLSEAERQQMEKTLRAFEKLPREQRAQCIRSFEKFAGLSLEERQQFLKNAERWRLMSSAERQAWRALVRQVPEFPPLPPGLISPRPVTPPPPPPGFVPPVATNGN